MKNDMVYVVERTNSQEWVQDDEVVGVFASRDLALNYIREREVGVSKGDTYRFGYFVSEHKLGQ